MEYSANSFSNADVARPTISTSEKPQTVTSYDGHSVSASIGDSIETAAETSISVHCAASGVPKPTITWFKDGEVFTSSARVFIYSNGSLEIPKALSSDSGEYSCSARNRIGESTMTSTVTVVGMCSSAPFA